MAFKGPIWEGIYSSFSEVPVTGPGYDGAVWVNNSLKKIAALREQAQKNAPLPPLSNYRQALLPLLATIIYQQKGSVRILDFSGGIGFTYYQTFYALQQTSGLEYNIVEREAVCRAGREFFEAESNSPYFLTSLDKVEGAFDIIHLGSVLQYIEDWSGLLARLAAMSPNYLLLIDVLAGNNQTFITSQNYYGSKIPTWFLNIGELIHTVETNDYKLMFMSGFLPTILGVEQSLPMENFESPYRLERTNNLLFVK